MNVAAVDLPSWRAALLYAVPLLYVLAAAMPALIGCSLERRWSIAARVSEAALLCAALSLLSLQGGGPAVLRAAGGLPLGPLGELGLGVRADLPGGLVLLLVTFIGWVIVRYSRTYLAGEPGQARYLGALLATLAAVGVVLVTNNLGVLALAWLGTSLALHRLLTFYSDRPQALVAAHKKFLASRFADVCMVAAVGLVGASLGTLEIDALVAKAQDLPALPTALQAAAWLIVASAALKCAQMPFHGWLIQVMEAPTPVSALLHAGVVNLGGFVLIRLGGFVAQVEAVSIALVVLGSLGAVLASLVMLTRITVKVALAWSTCAQMGFMLMQCGLGAYDLALLHLLAHSLYKAHAFLSAGGAVEQSRLRRLSVEPPAPGAAALVAGALGGLALVTAAAWLWGLRPDEMPAVWALAGITSLALAPVLMGTALHRGGWWPLALLVGAFAMACAYMGLHTLLAPWVNPAEVPAPGAGLLAWVLACFGGLFAMQALVRSRPDHAWVRRLYPWFYGGLHLDEWFTRLTLRLWPAHVTAAAYRARPPAPNARPARERPVRPAESRFGDPT